MLTFALPVVALVLAVQSVAPQASTGVVVDATGAPVAGARVRTVPASVEATTTAEGTFELIGLPPRVTLVISAPGFADLVTVVDGTAPAKHRFELQPRGIVESVTVTAERDGRRVTTPGSATVLDAVAIAEFPALTVDDRLRSVPGFSLFRRSSSRVANPTTQGVTLRGLSGSGASRTAVFADGVPANDPFGGWVYWNRVPLAAIDRIEVSRGGSSDIHGSDAMGGAIKIETASRGVNAIVEAGEDATRRLSLFGGQSRGAWDARGAIEAFSTDGYVTVGPESRGPIDVAATSEHATAYAGVGLPLGAHARLDARGGYFTEDRGNGTPFQTNGTVIRHGAVSAHGSLFQGAWTARAATASQDYDQTFSAVPAGRLREIPLSTQHVDSTSRDFAFEWLKALQRGTVMVGASSRSVDAELTELTLATNARSGADAEQRTAAAFVQATLALSPRTTLGAGLRGETWRSRRADGSDEKTAGFVVPRASIAFRASDAVSLRATYQDGHRSPTINELYRDFRVGAILTRANATLGPEHARGFEASALFTRRWTATRAAFFWTRMDDAVVNVTLQSTPSIIRQRQNAGRIRARGLEVESDLRVTDTIALTGALAIIDSSFTEGADLVGLRVPQVPRVQGSAGVRANWTRIAGALEWRFIGRQFDDDRNTPAFELDRSSIVDARAVYRVRRGVELFAALENAFDADQDVGRTPLRTIGLPRTFRAGVRLEFK